MGLSKHIPNLLTLGNLLCGVLAIRLVFISPREPATLWGVSILMGIALVCDFLDGFAARMLKVDSPLGKELDSLADMVTFGVLPGVLAYATLTMGVGVIAMDAAITPLIPNPSGAPGLAGSDQALQWLPFLGFLIPLFSALRLAKFNLDTRQTSGFLGLPTPANALFFWSLFAIMAQAIQESRVQFFHSQLDPLGHPFQSFWSSPLLWLVHPLAVAAFSIGFSLLLVSEFPLLALKFKSFGWKGNEYRWLLVLGALVLLGGFWHKGVPFFMILYFLLSFLDHRFNKQAE